MKKTIPMWAKAFGFNESDLTTQLEVAVYEAVEAIEAVEKMDIRQGFDAVCDFDWMNEMVKHLSDEGRSLEGANKRLLDAVDSRFGGVIRTHLHQAKYDVLESNFSKLCSTEDYLKETIEKYRNLGIETESEKIGGFWVVRSSKNQTDANNKDYGYRKALKSVEFFEPEFSFLKGC
jgi:metal-sulfur cluster biosynthetic enzyme